jgi:hypothetical protein
MTSDDDIKGDIRIILHRLSTMETTLAQIHVEVKKTNGRVTKLEMGAAEQEAAERATEHLMVEMNRRGRMTKQQIIQTIGTVIGGGLLALLIWFVGHSVN